MRKAEARRLLKKVVDGELGLAFTSHFWERVNERAPGLTGLHVYDLIRRGTIQDDPEFDAEFGNHVVKIRGTALELGTVQLVIAIKWLADAVTITIYKIR